MEPNVDGLIPLPRTSLKLREIYGTAPGYQSLWAGAVKGTFPTTQRGGRLFVAATDLPVIARAFGLIEPAPVVA